jgi:hypothetical protein
VGRRLSRNSRPGCRFSALGDRSKLREIPVKCRCFAYKLTTIKDRGDAVLIAPVSSQIPCKQGILQGNMQF